MATPKNSTLIVDENESLNLSSASSIKLSPILPPIVKNNLDDSDDDDDGDNNQDDDDGWLKKKSIYCKTIKSNGLREQSFGHGIYKVSENSEDDDQNVRDQCEHDDDDDEYNDGTTEIPIWICGEPRFVNGVHEKTTCNDMIQALIDDELSQQINTKNVAASRDLNDYVITEKWRDVEQILTGETLMLPIWNAWGVARNEVKFRLKINRTCTTTTQKTEPIPTITTKHAKNYNKIDVSHHKKTHRHHKKSKTEKMSFLSKMLRKILRQGEEIENQLTTLTATTKIINPSPQPQFDLNTENSDDELLLVIDSTHSRDTLNDDLYMNDSGDSGVHIKPCANSTNADYNMIPNYHATSENIISIKTPVNYFPPTTTSLYKLKTIHYDIKEKLVENTKLQSEKLLLKSKLNKKYYQYNCENNYYKKIFKIESLANIDRIQENLEIYKRDIIQIEYEILKIKIRINENLRILSELNELLKLEKRLKMHDSLREKFTDGVFEFSDNNGTLIV